VPTTDPFICKGSRIGRLLIVAVTPLAQTPDGPCYSLFTWLKTLVMEEKHNVPAAPEIQSSPCRSGTDTACCVATATKGKLRVEAAAPRRCGQCSAVVRDLLTQGGPSKVWKICLFVQDGSVDILLTICDDEAQSSFGTQGWRVALTKSSEHVRAVRSFDSL
jgi:hypothetical protein